MDGLIIIPSEGSKYIINQLVEEKFPVMLLERYFPDVNSNFVVTDNYSAAQKLASSLLSKGCRRIAYIGYEISLSTVMERKSGFGDVVRLVRDVEYFKQFEVRYSHLKEDVCQVISTIAVGDSIVDGVCCATNTIAYYVIKELIHLGLKISKDIHFASFDNNPFYEMSDLPVTYVKQPIIKLAEYSVDGLINSIEDKDYKAEGHKLSATIVEG